MELAGLIGDDVPTGATVELAGLLVEVTGTTGTELLAGRDVTVAMMVKLVVSGLMVDYEAVSISYHNGIKLLDAYRGSRDLSHHDGSRKNGDEG